MQKILDILKSSSHIEEVLQTTYTPLTKYVKSKNTQRQGPLMNLALYKSILKYKRLPSLEEFKEYLRENHTDYQNRDALAEDSLTQVAYIALINDLHFYFLLKESGKFDEVTISYEYDLYVKTDILVRRGMKTLGIQLYIGSVQASQKKEIEVAQIQEHLSYELILFPLNKNKENRKQLTLDHSSEPLYLYSEKDVETISQKLEQQHSEDYVSNLADELIQQQETFQEFIKLPEQSKKAQKIERIKMPIQHSVLIITDQDAVTKESERAKFEAEGIYGISIYLFKLPKQKKAFETIYIIDGDFSRYPKLLPALRKRTSLAHFNQEQYEVEHAAEEDMMVMAGAGSGKTHTLIQRTLYLVNTGKVKDLSEIVMITFTNEAADNMKYELEENLTQLFKETGQKKYLKHIQDIPKMRIMTIPAFAKYILQELGHHMGYGNRLNVSALTMERRKVITEVFQERYEEAPETVESLFEHMRPFEIRKFIEEVWDALSQKGILGESLKDHRFENKDELPQFINDFIIEAEHRLEEKKRESDVVTLSDLTKNLVRLSNQNVPLERLSNQFKYLFVDEFQDSDNTQIQFIATLAVKANIKLLVVGDIKQSIYRFRGANSTAFAELQAEVKRLDPTRQLKEYGLQYNYRTVGHTLESLESIFDGWRKKEYLPVEDQRMKPFRQDDAGTCEILKRQFSVRLVQELFQNLPKEQNGRSSVLAILVRTNYEVQDIGKQLKTTGIPTILRREGQLFASKAAKDLLNLLYSWIYHDQPWALYHFSQTYFYPEAMPQVELQEEGTMIQTSTIEILQPESWKNVLEQLKYMPFYIVLNDYLTEALKYVSEHVDDSLECLLYELNLQKIMSQLFSEMDIQTVDLIQVYRWLKIKVSTDRETDEATIDQEDYAENHIRVMTVHQSKGLQFDTVLIPNTGKPIVREVKDCGKGATEILVHVDGSNLDYGWYKKTKYGFESTVDNYSRLKQIEREEAFQEEARVLYVALTRVKNHLYVCEPKGKKSTTMKNWKNLIEEGKRS